ncbi:MAG: YceI family protein [Actinomycetota bacterium]
MAIAPGTYNFGPNNGQMLVKVFREGVAKKVGHDLIIEVKSWSATATIAEQSTESSFSGSADVGSVSVLRGDGGVKPLSDGDKADIKKNITQKIITVPSITFQSSGVNPSTNTVSGTMSIMGKSQPVDIKLTETGGQVKANITVVQSKWGIKPFQAMMGALKVRDAVDVEITATP